MWVDLVLKGIGLASTIIATLQAGSRVAFLTDHNAIGILEGPTISRPPANETDKENGSGTSLFEISEAFRHSVRLSFAPQLYESVKFDQPVETVVEPYPLSVRPHLDSKQGEEEKEDKKEREALREANDVLAAVSEGVQSTFNETNLDMNETLLEYNETFNDESAAITTTDKGPSFSKRLAFAINPLNGARIIASWIPPAIQHSQEYLAVTPKLATFYAKKALHKQVGEEEIASIMSGRSLLL